MTNYKNTYPALAQYTYLNTASCGLLSRQNLQLIQQLTQQYAEQGSLTRDAWHGEITSIREEAADFMGASPAEVGLITNFTNGVHQVAQLLREYPRVLLVADDYPSLITPWHLLGYEVHTVPSQPDGNIPLEAIERSMRQHHIQVLAVSHVQYSSGFRLPLAALSSLCRHYNSLLLVDATQSLGMIPINLRETPVDVLIASGYKWMTAGLGNGLLYMREHLHSNVRPVLLGFGAVGSQVSPEVVEKIPFTPQALEAGHYNFFSLLLLRQAIRELKETGMSNIFSRLMALRQQFTDALPSNLRLISDYAIEESSGIIVVEAPADTEEQLKARNIITSTRPRGLRISLHFYNDAQDIQRVCQALAELR